MVTAFRSDHPHDALSCDCCTVPGLRGVRWVQAWGGFLNQPDWTGMSLTMLVCAACFYGVGLALMSVRGKIREDDYWAYWPVGLANLTMEGTPGLSRVRRERPAAFALLMAFLWVFQLTLWPVLAPLGEWKPRK
ncbi:hypothetical protein [Streptacidiphilus albus]|uniref:hypothetical protein n=1 Tax=Streptacidiphilus albus TaxID=105425 RepID=UPI00054C7703|nr:hypothetical protein [Streptacidiphilus albus]